MIDDKELNKRFDYYVPDAARIAQHHGIREFYKGLAEYIIDSTPEGREQSLALTHLEISMFWANASIARQGDK